ncbi:MAG: DNA methyltransferase [Chloroflexota bacterium]|nr:DNA methyltransferase [Chloroflexota bacterium]
METRTKNAPGRVRDAIIQVLDESTEPLSIGQISARVSENIGETPTSSVRSYLRLNTPGLFLREGRGLYRSSNPRLTEEASRGPVGKRQEPFRHLLSVLHHDDCLPWLERQPGNSFHAVVTDPPYALYEYSDCQQAKLRSRKGGVWRIPPSFDGAVRNPIPRFTTLNQQQLAHIREFFELWGKLVRRAIVPGANVVVASNPLVSYLVSEALANSGLERRGEIIRLTMTMRGGDRPKGAHEEFPDVSVLPRSMWEPWLLFRKPLDGRVQDNLRKWGTGGFRRPGQDKPFGDVLPSAPTRASERRIAPHPSLKPQSYMRTLVRGVLPTGEGVVLDPFAGAGSTLAACNVVGYSSVGVEKDAEYFTLARESIPKLTEYGAD